MDIMQSLQDFAGYFFPLALIYGGYKLNQNLDKQIKNMPEERSAQFKSFYMQSREYEKKLQAERDALEEELKAKQHKQ